VEGILSKRRWLGVGVAAFVLAGAGEARAGDSWEAPQVFAESGDDNMATNNTLSHGLFQQHDLAQDGGVNDQDWSVAATIGRHSYEARISGTSIGFNLQFCAPCAQFERVNGAGAILTEDTSVFIAPATTGSYDRTIRWIASATTVNDFIRVKGASDFAENASSVYTLRFWDTTYSIPRWNNTGQQVTVLMISNLTASAVDGRIDFYDAQGTLLHTEPFTVGETELYLLNTATVPALAGFSGHAYVAHLGGYGGLAGKAVSMEPSTGFAFESPLTPIPH
jgi:hypothetical protein